MTKIPFDFDDLPDMPQRPWLVGSDPKPFKTTTGGGRKPPKGGGRRGLIGLFGHTYIPHPEVEELADPVSVPGNPLPEGRSVCRPVFRMGDGRARERGCHERGGAAWPYGQALRGP